jgi:hypothetical protein
MMAAMTMTCAWGRECVSKGRLATALLVPLATVVVFACAFAPAAGASPSFTWTGISSVTENWSSLENWQGEVAPTNSMAIETITFPRLTSAACTTEEEQHPCYISFNDLAGLSAESIQIDDGDGYLIGGEALALGSGGITASPAPGTGGPAGDYMLMPLMLAASQRWSVADRSGGKLEENGLLVGSAVTGSGSALTVEQSNGSALVFDENDTEVGPLTLEATNTYKQHIENGSVFLQNGDLNSSDRQAVSLRNIFFTGVGAMGPLSAHAATLEIGTLAQPAGALHATSVVLDATTGVLFEVRGEGATPQIDYSQLVSPGAVELGGADVVVLVGPPKAGRSCPTLTQGETFTLVSTTGSLSGSFANAPEPGPEIPVDFAKGCEGENPTQSVRIGYHRSGATKTVTATVEAAAIEETETAKLREEEAAAQTKREEEAAATTKQEELIRRLIGERAKVVAEEAAASADKEHEEEAATKKRQEEMTTANGAGAKGGVLAAKETAKPQTATRAQLLAKGLKACRKQPTRHRRALCEARARKKYGSRKGGKQRK